MKNLTINGYDFAIFEVEKTALHVTVTSVNKYQSVRINEFKKDVQPALLLLNHFTETYKTLPTEWLERTILNGQDNKQELVIVIIK